MNKNMKWVELPERLKHGAVVKFPSGIAARVVVLSRTGDCGEPLYRMRYEAREDEDTGFYFPTVTGTKVWDHDELYALGVRAADGKEQE